MIPQSPLLRQLTIEEIEEQELNLAKTIFKDKSPEFLKTRMWIHTHPMDSMNHIKVMANQHPKFLDILHDPDLWLRCDQLFTWEEDKDTLLYLAGRGIGKSKTASFTLIKEAMREKQRISLWAPTYPQIRDVSFNGDSGILETIHPDLLKQCNYNKTLLSLEFPNGSLVTSFSAESSASSRGSQCGLSVCEETAQWSEEAFADMQMTVRLGKNPRTLILTTPRPTALIKKLVASPNTQVIKGTTYQNYFLSPKYVTKLESELTSRMQAQELRAEILTDNVYAMFKMSDIHDCRVSKETFDISETIRRLVIAIDPSVSSNEKSDATGIVVAGLGHDNKCYILEDATMEQVTAEGWSNKAIDLYKKYKAYDVDVQIVAEKNNGGNMISAVINTAARAKLDGYLPPVRLVTATRGKEIRAEMPSAMYERHEVSHVGELQLLEQEITEWNPTDKNAKSPNRLDALVWAITALSKSANGIITASYGNTSYENKLPSQQKINPYCGYS